MSFEVAFGIVVAIALFVALATMAHLLARLTVVERALSAFLEGGVLAPRPQVQLSARLREVIGSTAGRRQVVAFLSPDCSSCVLMLEAIAAWPEERRRSTVLIYKSPPDDRFVAPPGVKVIPNGADHFDECGVRTGPVVVEIVDGSIVGVTSGLPANGQMEGV